MGSLDPVAIITLFAGILYLVGGIFVFIKRNHHPKAAWVMIIYTAISCLWALGQALGRFGLLNFLIEDVWQRIPTYGIVLMTINFFFLGRAFLHSKGHSWVWWLFAAVWIVGLVLLDVNVFALPDTFLFQGGRSLPRQSAVLIVLIAGWAIFMGGAALMVMRMLRQLSSYYTSASYWALVLILTFLGDGIFFAKGIALGNILHLAGTLLATQVISTTRLPDLTRYMRKSFSYAVFTMIALVLYTICLVAAQLILRIRSDLSPAIAGMVMAFFLVLFFNPLVGKLREALDQWLSGEIQDPTNLLRQYSQSITNTLDFQLLATVAVGTASEFLEIQRGFLFLVDYEKGVDDKGFFHLRGVKGMGDTNPDPGKLREDSPLAVFFRSASHPLTQGELDHQTRFREVAPNERSWLSNLGMDLYLPIYAKNEWIGLLCLGPKTSGAAFTDQDLALLSTMADQTAVALENTRLVEGLVRLNNDFRRAYSALDQANRHLERLDRTKSDFISIASHELRTPLTLISGSSQMLLDDPALHENPYYRQLLSKIHAGTVRLHEIVDSMLDIAKIDMRALDLETQPVLVKDLINAVCGDLKQAYTERKQTIETQNLEGLPAINADPEALRKVFYQLIVNAIKYTPDEGEISISGRALEPNMADLPKGGVEIVICDNGIGIDPRYQELIFSKFYQTGELSLHSTGKTKFKGGGPGLGLAISRGIIEAHHGRIWVESPGHDEEKRPGSKFFVVLPVRMVEVIKPPKGPDMGNEKEK